MSKLAVQAGPEKRSVARYVRLCFFSVTGKSIPQNYACAATCLTCQSRVNMVHCKFVIPLVHLLTLNYITHFLAHNIAKHCADPS